MVFLSRAIASQHNIPYALRQILETPSACHPKGDIVLRKIFDSLCSQCHSATPEYHPSPSPPTTRYLEIILFTDSLTLELAAAQLCSTRHGLSPSAHLHSQLASTPGSTISPSDHLRITTNAMLAALCNATTQRSRPSQFSAPTSIRARHTHCTALSCPVS